MRPPIALVVVTVVVVVLSGIDATVETTCKAAADEDTHVNYVFYVSELRKHHRSYNADTWGLAKVAANMGVNNAYGAIHDIEGLLVKPNMDAKMKVVLEKCQELYNKMKFALAGAYDEINSRNYAIRKEEVAKAVSLAHECDDAFMKAAVPSPLNQHSFYSEQIVIVCTAITNFIK
ncbi:pectinesterase inhibitor 8-like [Hordeum vulgare subsp. vulgare]|uniref:pectinesterase inhibitor 8-like n=1 Tax=Hordeum vulgare subsp. vulgare TaxID=112509 RepID=UPI001D1A34FF|nr:pectinesterase inhibitor 8-like [Hordeum vulgare subsp. vulgare]